MNATVDALLRQDLRDFAGYRSARSEAGSGDAWLNANESAWDSAIDDMGLLRRYPSPQPETLRAALAGLYGVDAARLLVGRGSDEGIDLLLRAFCAPGGGSIVVGQPTFGMYAVCARLQGARMVEVPTPDGADGFRSDLDAMGDAALDARASLVFLCSPGNPSGESLPLDAIAVLARRVERRAIVVVDEAYGEYDGQASAAGLIGNHQNLVVLRTLSKAHALAAARIGCVLADAALIAVLRRCQAPYPVPRPCADLALSALAPLVQAQTRARIALACSERDRMADALQAMPCVRRMYPSMGNFLLVRFIDADDALSNLQAAGIVVRDMRLQPRLEDALRITIGTVEQNNRVLIALSRCRTDVA